MYRHYSISRLLLKKFLMIVKIVAGDFNFNLLNTPIHNGTLEFLEKRVSNFLLPVIMRPSILCPTKIKKFKLQFIYLT